MQIKKNNKSQKAVRIILCLLFCIGLGTAIFFCVKNYTNIYSVQAQIISEREIDIEDSIEIIFNQRVVYFNSENIKISPAVDFEYNLSEEGKNLSIKAKNAFASETKYQVNLVNVRGVSGLLLENASFGFYTSNNQEDYDLRSDGDEEKYYANFELSRNRFIVPEISRPKTKIVIEPQIKEGRYIDVSIKNQVLSLFDNGVKINEFLISTGKKGMPTPLGTYAVKRKETNHWSTSYGLWMPYSMNFFGAYYIHELPYWPSGYREGENHLGIRVSHGCIRLGVGVAKYVFDWSDIGTPIYVH